MKLSVVIPARNEAGCVGSTVERLAATLGEHGVDYEIVVVDDASTDGTWAEAERLAAGDPRVTAIRSPYRGGFGLAVRAGLEVYTGDAVAIVMADGSDDPLDVVRYQRLLENGYDCAFGSRFARGSVVRDYPLAKLVINRVANLVVRALVRHNYNDTTNAFKAYRREVIDGLQPLLSHHFNLTVELPLKAVVRGYSYAIIPISWTNRAAGSSKLSLKEMGSRYLFILLYVLLERHLTRGDYHHAGADAARGARAVRRFAHVEPDPPLSASHSTPAR